MGAKAVNCQCLLKVTLDSGSWTEIPINVFGVQRSPFLSGSGVKRLDGEKSAGVNS